MFTDTAPNPQKKARVRASSSDMYNNLVGIHLTLVHHL